MESLPKQKKKRMAAASSLSIFLTLQKPNTIKISKTKPSLTCKAHDSSSSCSSVSVSSENSNKKKKPFLQVGIGLLAASMLILSPLENANATRLNYYATVEEPSCELKFVPSGLGYCDLVVGSGLEAPYNQLINVSFSIFTYYFCFLLAVCFLMQYLFSVLDNGFFFFF